MDFARNVVTVTVYFRKQRMVRNKCILKIKMGRHKNNCKK